MKTRPVVAWALLPFLALILVQGSRLSSQEKSIERMRQDLMFLASEECEGRGVDTKGINLAADYIAAQFAKVGVKPGLGEKGYFQPFAVYGSSKLEGPSALVLRGPRGQEIRLAQGVDFQTLTISSPGKAKGPLVFAGYGATAKDIGYDDFAGLDVAGKVVVVLRRVPRWDSKELPFDGANRDVHAGLINKFTGAEVRKAAAVILVNDASVAAKDALLTPAELATERPRSLPALQLKRDLLDQVLRSSRGQGLHELEHAIDGDLKPRSGELAGWSAEVEAGVVRTMLPAKNVIGVLEGNGPLAKETIVIGAHYDHLGYGGAGSLAKLGGKKAIHFGADDNGSGTTALIELARRFAAIKDRQGRRIVFIAFSGEERGLLGSAYYCDKEPIFALEATAAMLNLDMVGRMEMDMKSGKPKLLVEGAGSSKSFEKLISEKNAGLELGFSKLLMPNSDHFSFFKKNIPVIFFWTGIHKEYHRPTDVVDKINFDGMVQIVDLSEKIVGHLTAAPERFDFIKIPVAGGKATGAPRLGIAPNYVAGEKGLRIGDIVDGGGAQKAGLKAGDLIVEIANQPVLDIDTYLVIMRTQKVGAAIDVVVERDGKRLSFKVTPLSK